MRCLAQRRLTTTSSPDRDLQARFYQQTQLLNDLVEDVKRLVSTNPVSANDANGLPPERLPTNRQIECHLVTRSSPSTGLQDLRHQHSQSLDGLEEPAESLVSNQVSLNDSRGPPPVSLSPARRVITTKKWKARLCSTELTTYSVLVGHLSVRSIVYETDSDNRKQRREVFFRPSPWLLHQGYTLLSKKSYGRWEHTFRSYNIISTCHPLFAACRAGDLGLVQQMCSQGQGQVTPFDMAPNGWSLLHVRLESVES